MMNRNVSARPSTRTLSLALALLITAATFTPTRANAQEECNLSEHFAVCFDSAETRDRVGPPTWSATGSTGIVDETGRNKFGFRGTDAYVKDGHRGTVILRYPIDIKAYAAGLEALVVRYKDEGPNSRVRVKLIASTLTTPDHRDYVLAEFDSDDRSSSTDIQTYVLSIRPDLLGTETIMHLEVRLTRGHGGDPRITALALASAHPEAPPLIVE